MIKKITHVCRWLFLILFLYPNPWSNIWHPGNKHLSQKKENTIIHTSWPQTSGTLDTLSKNTLGTNVLKPLKKLSLLIAMNWFSWLLPSART